MQYRISHASQRRDVAAAIIWSRTTMSTIAAFAWALAIPACLLGALASHHPVRRAVPVTVRQRSRRR
ncbi:hypothetical protein [Bradyrhizobium sp. 2TAF24]|uniref:hypothetical protein n=1 Tax=Bradyrhizobium sp. 2TAF24 TaxID=3233011 RepID=UPI003F902375